MNLNNHQYSKITTAHQAKIACVYLRQSTLGQLAHNTESTIRQYGLVDRAVTLGWPKDRIQVIDEDLGRSGTSTEFRSGFQQLLVQVGLSQVGMVLSIEASRLARNNSDWAHLIQICSVFGTLVADAESVYDPRLSQDRLLLGLVGIISEAEIYSIKARMEAGKRSKAARGELHLPLPAGYERLSSGEVRRHSNEEIQAGVRLVLEKFRQLGSARAVLVYLRREGLKVPIRLLKGPGPHEVTWAAPSANNVLGVLQNPAYAGAYVYGHHKTDPTRHRPDKRYSGIVRQPIDSWDICLQDAYPAYISWEEFVSNQKRLASNQNDFLQEKQGVPRQGSALLQGIVLCGKCGHHMMTSYSGKKDQSIYECMYDSRAYGSPVCQTIRGQFVDAEVERLVLEALEPDRIAIALEALEHLEQEGVTLERQWKLSLQRAQYEASCAERDYRMCEPENRLVARNLECHWEEKLRQVEKVEREYQAWRNQNHTIITDADRREILALGEDLPKLWAAPSTTHADRKQIIRLLIKSVTLDKNRERGKLWFKINWQTGATTGHWLIRRVGNYRDHADFDRLQQRVRELTADEKTDRQIAVILTHEGFRSSRGEMINPSTVGHLRKRWDLGASRRSGQERSPDKWEDGTYSIQGVMAVIGVPQSLVYRWLRQGLLEAKQTSKGAPWRITLSEERIAQLKEESQKQNHQVGRKNNQSAPSSECFSRPG